VTRCSDAREEGLTEVTHDDQLRREGGSAHHWVKPMMVIADAVGRAMEATTRVQDPHQ
jgi:hypothetical protein